MKNSFTLCPVSLVVNVFCFFFKKLLIYFWMCWIFTAAQASLQLRRVGATL